LVAYDVKEGREELNFSEWNRYSRDFDVRKEIVEEVAEGEMPLPIYLIAHPNSSVSKEELVALKQWAGYEGHSRHEHHD
jgi:DNA-binding response OmpR family regulator